MGDNGLNKRLKLKSTKDIALLFEQGKTVYRPPISCRYRLITDVENPEIKVAFSAPKKIFPKAVDRNKKKRLLREAYRIQKLELDQLSDNTSLHVMFFYSSKTDLSMTELLERMRELINKLKRQVLKQGQGD